MNERTITIKGITHVANKGFYIATVEMSLVRPDKKTRNNIRCEVRLEGSKENSFEDLQGKILQEARVALGDAAELLQEVSPETLHQYD